MTFQSIGKVHRRLIPVSYFECSLSNFDQEHHVYGFLLPPSMLRPYLRRCIVCTWSTLLNLCSRISLLRALLWTVPYCRLLWGTCNRVLCYPSILTFRYLSTGVLFCSLCGRGRRQLADLFLLF